MRKKSEILTEFAPREHLDKANSFFLVGIGGAGMAGTAEMLRIRGLKVKGTDSTDSAIIERLRSLGCEIHIGHTGEFIQHGDVLILSDAIDLATSPEVAAARKLGVSLFRRSQLLGWLVKDKKVVAVTGTHGKTTTTAMIGSALQAAHLDPLVIVGADVEQFGGSVIWGEGEWCVLEACEAYDSLRDLDPTIAVLTNLEPDHLDFHGDFDGLKQSVGDFLRRSEKAIVYCEADAGAKALAEEMPVTRVPYSESTITDSGIELATFGKHNRENASAAVEVAKLVGADIESSLKGIADFRGAVRRLQVISAENPTLLDDYAHHPTEIENAISAIRARYPDRRLVVVFQPHLYSRTADFLPAFAKALSAADLLVLTDIYPAREAPIPGMSSFRIAELVKDCPVKYVPSRHLLAKEVSKLYKAGDVVVGMGAGNIDRFPGQFMDTWRRGDRKKVWVVSGGDTSEREVSILSGMGCTAALRRKGYDVLEIDITEHLLGKGTALPPLPDVAFLAVHGMHLEGGAMQGFFEILHVPHTGSNMQASVLAMNKSLTKSMLVSHGVRVPAGVIVSQVTDPINLPGVSRFVVKPNSDGSTVGLSFVESLSDLPSAIAKALAYGGEALVEEWVEGLEISVPVLGDRALPAVEIRPKSGAYDFANKYIPGATEEVCPARLTPELSQLVADIALKSHQVLGCAGATRTDMIITENGPVVLELNTLPGMTPTSLLPLSAKTAGIEFDELCDWLVEDALERDGQKT